MKRTMNILAIAVSLVFTNNIWAQQPQQQPEQLKYILEWAGHWEGPAVLKMAGQELKFTYYGNFKKTAMGSGLEMHEWGEIPGMGKLDGNNLIGFDPHDGKIHWYSVDNVGTTHEHTGSFSDHDHFSMVHKSTRDGKTYIENIEMTRIGKDKMNLKLVATLDGKTEEELIVIFNRKGSKPVAAK
jgi:hypothetical protein